MWVARDNRRMGHLFQEGSLTDGECQGADMRMQRQRCFVGMVVATVVPTIEKSKAGR